MLKQIKIQGQLQAPKIQRSEIPAEKLILDARAEKYIEVLSKNPYAKSNAETYHVQELINDRSESFIYEIFDKHFQKIDKELGDKVLVKVKAERAVEASMQEVQYYKETMKGNNINFGGFTKGEVDLAVRLSEEFIKYQSEKGTENFEKIEGKFSEIVKVLEEKGLAEYSENSQLTKLVREYEKLAKISNNSIEVSSYLGNAR